MSTIVIHANHPIIRPTQLNAEGLCRPTAIWAALSHQSSHHSNLTEHCHVASGNHGCQQQCSGKYVLMLLHLSAMKATPNSIFSQTPTAHWQMPN